jgi:hypothetical protein
LGRPFIAAPRTSILVRNSWISRRSAATSLLSTSSWAVRTGFDSCRANASRPEPGGRLRLREAGVCASLREIDEVERRVGFDLCSRGRFFSRTDSFGSSLALHEFSCGNSHSVHDPPNASGLPSTSARAGTTARSSHPRRRDEPMTDQRSLRIAPRLSPARVRTEHCRELLPARVQVGRQGAPRHKLTGLTRWPSRTSMQASRGCGKGPKTSVGSCVYHPEQRTIMTAPIAV